jgi:hypothetical protein
VKPLETLRALGAGGEAPVEAKQRVYGALMASLAAAAAAGAGAVVEPASLAPTPASIVGLTGTKALLIAGGIWLFGGATGAVLYGALHRREERVVYVDRPVFSNSIASPPAESAASADASAAPLRSGPDPSARRVAVASVKPPSELSRERALLDLARANAASGAQGLVLQQTELHRAQFPRGKLAEEREALAIRALLSLGRADEARSRARVFHLTYPNSFLTPAIDSALSAP